jgi:AbrB family looped-hinge helix DNA binding protein
MKELLSSVSPKGQVTIPIEIRTSLGLKQGDKVAFALDGHAVKLTPARSSIGDFYQSVPALTPPRALEEMTRIAADEHAREAAKEGL